MASTSNTSPSTQPNDTNNALNALIQSFSLIIFSEIGDKTFLIAAILAMRHPRLIVFSGAFSSLLLMSILSAEMGHLLPTLIPKQWTQLAAAVLFVVFGAKMWVEARGMKGGCEEIREEMKEAEEEIEEDEAGVDGDDGVGMIPLEEMEEGRPSFPSALVEKGNGHAGVEKLEAAESPKSPVSPRWGNRSRTRRSLAEGARNFCSLFLGPVFVQAFVLTFLGEWGDRSQIATIALGAAHNVYLVALGTIVGHSCCTALAVIGGRYVSTKISVKHVTCGGSILFLLFGLIYFYEALAVSSEMEMSIPIGQDERA
ncbi:hypothetical protein AX17_006919 [Amanita inopinata Kibby_2008]|nr:hypothetical protein AX17_006919 [Amanita inopinata Kibby_2008]